MNIKKRAFITKYFLHPLQGITLQDWVTLLRQNGFRIDLPYLPRASLITLTSMINTIAEKVETCVYEKKIEKVVLSTPPIFLLGHYRSGTTFLYRLLCQDSQFAYPTVYQAYFPNTFLSTESIFSPIASFFLMQRRAQDSLDMRVSSPADDESALCATTLLSPYLGQAFPSNRHLYDRYLSFCNVDEKEINIWKDNFRYFVKKLAYKKSGVILLKSPPHTARVNLLLELYPNARFIHIHRNPYAVYQSTMRLLEDMVPVWQLQTSKNIDIHSRVLDNYETMYNKFLCDRSRIPANQFYEMSFEDLENDPINKIRDCYLSLGLRDFECFQCKLQKYLTTISAHKKSFSPEMLKEPFRSTVASRWKRFFHEWGYAID